MGSSPDIYELIKHYGFDDLFDNPGNGDRKKGIMDNLAPGKPDHGKICGFTGPIRVQESGGGVLYRDRNPFVV